MKLRNTRGNETQLNGSVSSLEEMMDAPAKEIKNLTGENITLKVQTETEVGLEAKLIEIQQKYSALLLQVQESAERITQMEGEISTLLSLTAEQTKEIQQKSEQIVRLNDAARQAAENEKSRADNRSAMDRIVKIIGVGYPLISGMLMYILSPKGLDDLLSFASGFFTFVVVTPIIFGADAIGGVLRYLHTVGGIGGFLGTVAVLIFIGMPYLGIVITVYFSLFRMIASFIYHVCDVYTLMMMFLVFFSVGMLEFTNRFPHTNPVWFGGGAIILLIFLMRWETIQEWWKEYRFFRNIVWK